MGWLRRLGGWSVGLCAAGLLASQAAADDGGSKNSVSDVVWLLLFISLAYLLARVVVVQVEKRFLVISGVEYIGLGILVGPALHILPVFEVLTEALPIIALAVGWFGLLRGMELRTAALRLAPRGTRRLAMGDNFFAGGLVALASFALLESGLFGEVGEHELILISGFLGCAAATCGTEPINVIGRRYRVEGPTQALLQASARIGDSAALFVFGVLMALCRPQRAEALANPALAGPGWVIIAILLGLVLGLMFTPFLGDDDSRNNRFLALVGIITFATGAGSVLTLSPMLICLVLGVVLVNTSRAGQRIHSTLAGTERPLSLALLVFAGALWRPPERLDHAFMLFTVFVLARLLGKWLSSRLAAAGGLMRQDMYRGQLSHGDAAVAMTLGVAQVFQDVPLVNAAYTAVLASVVLHDFVAPRALRSLLVDSGELRREQTN